MVDTQQDDRSRYNPLELRALLDSRLPSMKSTLGPSALENLELREELSSALQEFAVKNNELISSLADAAKYLRHLDTDIKELQNCLEGSIPLWTMEWSWNGGRVNCYSRVEIAELGLEAVTGTYSTKGSGQYYKSVGDEQWVLIFGKVHPTADRSAISQLLMHPATEGEEPSLLNTKTLEEFFAEMETNLKAVHRRITLGFKQLDEK